MCWPLWLPTEGQKSRVCSGKTTLLCRFQVKTPPNCSFNIACKRGGVRFKAAVETVLIALLWGRSNYEETFYNACVHCCFSEFKTTLTSSRFYISRDNVTISDWISDTADMESMLSMKSLPFLVSQFRQKKIMQNTHTHTHTHHRWVEQAVGQGRVCSTACLWSSVITQVHWCSGNILIYFPQIEHD